MNQKPLALLSLILCFIYLQFFWTAKAIQNPTPYLKKKIASLQIELKRSHLRELLQVENLQQFRQDVAVILPEALKHVTQKPKDYPLRNMASVLMTSQNEKLAMIGAKNLFLTGKALFKKKDFISARRMFDKVIKNYSYSEHVIESFYLLSECEYALGNLESSQAIIDQMVTLFPESEMTGYALIRLGIILSERHFVENAIQTYRLILNTSPYQGVINLAKSQLSELGL
ncbi:MAG: tetratricopeptide repeat protein [Bdellovibrionales bacterium]|nr:tetratricopeptide repeat protein [Bdellovibrionales bacterium]